MNVLKKILLYLKLLSEEPLERLHIHRAFGGAGGGCKGFYFNSIIRLSSSSSYVY